MATRGTPVAGSVALCENGQRSRPLGALNAPFAVLRPPHAAEKT